MKKRYFVWKMAAVVLCVVLCVAAMTVNTPAYTRIDTDRETSLTVRFASEEAAFSDVKFALYHIADVSAVADYALTEAFADSGIVLEDMTADTWQKATDALVACIAENRIAPVAEKATDAEGILTFAGLKAGLYLVVGEEVSTEEGIYMPTAFLMSLPHLEPGLDAWDYDVVANVKYTLTPVLLPQTGQLWWPVAVVIPGVLLVVAGSVLLRREEQKRTN